MLLLVASAGLVATGPPIQRSSDMSSADYDPFRPRHEPARSIYEAFQEEAAHRRHREVHVWIRAERDVVHNTAVRLAPTYDLRPPSIGEVEAAERRARGHIDYGMKWALYVVEAMRRPGENHE